jgi:N-acetylglucosamine-6-phosphate deacetylase
MISLIPDCIHVSPALFRIAHKLAGPSTIYYVSDAMAAAGAGPGRFKLGRLTLEVGDDQIVRLPGSPNFAGSALQPIDGVFRAAEMLGCPWHQAWRSFSETPTRFMGWEHGLKVGGPADFCLAQITEPNRIESLKTYSGGELVGER